MGSLRSSISNLTFKASIHTVTWMARALLGNGPLNTPRYTHATTERGYATRFYETAR
jgi:hypothetical protein